MICGLRCIIMVDKRERIWWLNMSREFIPDYNNIVRAAGNLKPDRVPLYEHIISTEVMEKILNQEIVPLWEGDRADKKEFFRRYTRFFRETGYDTVSFECRAV